MSHSGYRMMLKFSCALLLCLLLGQATTAHAQLKLKKLFRQNLDADRNKTYHLTKKQGPWLIACASFTGKDAARQANDLVYELRKNYKLEAFVYKKTFDYRSQIKGIGYSSTETVKGRDGKTNAKPIKMKAVRADHFDEIAVVVGNFPGITDKKTQTALNRIKHLQPRSLEVSATVNTNQSYARMREELRKRNKDGKIKGMGPMRQAMVIPNPLLPEEYFQRQSIDANIIKLNNGLEYGLLNNKKPYTVRVATFRGHSDFGSSQKIEQQKQSKKKKKITKLAIAAAKAHRLTEELRKRGVEAYEFHDRHESYVCVGGYDWVKKKRRDGKDELNPQIARIIKSYEATKQDFGQLRGAIQPKSLPNIRHLGIVFDVQPRPVVVPRK